MTINKGDIITLKCGDNKMILIAYDKYIGISAGLTGIKVIELQTIPKRYTVSIYSPNRELSWAKRKAVSRHLVSLITKMKKISLAERFNFSKHVINLYNEIFNIQLLENIERPTIENIENSNHLIKYK